MAVIHGARRAVADRSTASILPEGLIIAIALGVILTVAATVAVFRNLGADWWVLLRDPAASMGFAPSVGLFSHVGVLAMAMGGAICLFAAAGIRDPQRTVLLRAGLLTAWLALDDLFLLHESVIPRLTGLPEMAVLAAYAAAAAGIFWTIGRPLASRRFLGLWTAVGFLAVMLLTDLAYEHATSVSLMVEEVAKQCGWLLWSAFWVAYAAREIRAA